MEKIKLPTETHALTDAAVEFRDTMNQLSFVSEILDDSTVTDPLTLECHRHFKTVLSQLKGEMTITLSIIKEFLQADTDDNDKEKAVILEHFEKLVSD